MASKPAFAEERQPGEGRIRIGQNRSSGLVDLVSSNSKVQIQVGPNSTTIPISRLVLESIANFPCFILALISISLSSPTCSTWLPPQGVPGKSPIATQRLEHESQTTRAQSSDQRHTDFRSVETDIACRRGLSSSHPHPRTV